MAHSHDHAMPADMHAAHDKHAGHSVSMFRDKFWGSVILSVPTLVWSPMIQEWLGFRAPGFTGSRYIPAISGTVLFLYGGMVFLRGAARELRDRLPGMMTLISLAITVAFAFSMAVTLGVPGMDLWWELATLITIMILGHWIEMRSISQAQGALHELAKLVPDEADRVTPQGTERVPVANLKEHDVVLLRPGASAPVDGIVVDGQSAMNEAMITGESRPVEKKKGDKIIAGTVNGSASLRVEVTGTGEKTTLAGIMRLVAEAQNSKSRAQALADRTAFLLTIVAIVSAVLTLVIWKLAGASTSFAIERVVTVLVIACPHALGLAIPLVIGISTTLGAQSGLLVRDRRGLENARNLDAVFFDKTGTLTRGEFRVVAIVTAPGVDETEALRLAAAVEQDSEHSIAQGIVTSAKERGISIPASSDFRAIPGEGADATVEGRALSIGGPAMLRGRHVDLGGSLQQLAQEAEERSQAVVALLENGQPVAALAIADAVRDEAAEAVAALHRQGIEVVMITGDSKAVADAVAKQVGIDTVHAEILPDKKASTIEAERKKGRRVAMVGDGVNDAPALLTANVGIAIGAGTDVAVEAGDIILIRNDPRDVPKVIELSRATYRKMVQNLWWAAGYNVVAIPLAAGVLASRGLILSPAVGAILMSVSTIIVALNAQLLKRGYRMPHEQTA